MKKCLFHGALRPGNPLIKLLKLRFVSLSSESSITSHPAFPDVGNSFRFAQSNPRGMPAQRNARRHRGGGGRDEPSDDDGNPPPPPPPEPRHPQAPNIPRGGQSIANSGSPSGFMESTFRSYRDTPTCQPPGEPKDFIREFLDEIYCSIRVCILQPLPAEVRPELLKKFSLRS